MKRKIISAVLIGLIAAVLTIQLLPREQKESKDSARNTLIAAHIYDSLNNSLEKPMIFSRAMASDTLLHRALRNEEETDIAEMEQMMMEYLAVFKDKFGYIAAFVVSEKTRRYYTPGGISKVMNTKEDPYDIWYELFIDSGKDLDLDTDRDYVNNYRWTVFINVRISDTDGTLLGVCGIGLFMDSLQDLFLSAEKEYNVKINLIDPEGLVQVDTDSSNIENAYISDAIADKAGNDAFTYTERSEGGFRITRYMENLEWFLVVQNFTGKEDGIDPKIPILICSYLILAALLCIILIGSKEERQHILVKSDLTIDGLTGLPNRNYLKESYGELGVFNTTRYKSLAMFDIDRFKIINESLDGDEIILRVVELAKEAIDEHGIMFRWSGDEFVIFLEMDVKEAEEKLKEFCKEVQKKLFVTVSVGLVAVDLSESIKTNYHRAVQPCYAVKESGGNGVGVGRR